MPIIIANYDKTWPLRFEAEKARIAAALGSSLAAIEHIGSTSVPRLAAKPIVDIMPGLSNDRLHECVEPLVALGYEYVSRFEDVMPFRRYFRVAGDPASGCPGLHIHVVEYGGEFWQRHILFRDLLRSNAQIRTDYEQLKRRLAPLYDDQNEYAEAKTEFIRAAVAAGRKAFAES